MFNYRELYTPKSWNKDVRTKYEEADGQKR